jgi:hypothetical protein
MPKFSYGTLFNYDDRSSTSLLTRHNVSSTPSEKGDFWSDLFAISKSAPKKQRKEHPLLVDVGETASDKHSSSSVPVLIAAVITAVLLYIISTIKHERRHQRPH